MDADDELGQEDELEEGDEVQHGTIADAAAELARERSEANDKWLARVGRWALIFLGLAALTGILCGLKDWHVKENDVITSAEARSRALVVASLLTYGALLAGSLALRQDGGLRRFLIGKDGRFSTSQAQAAVWTLGLFFVLLHLVLQAPLGSPRDVSDALDNIDEVYLLLLGIPFATLLASGLITSTKVDNKTVQKVEASEARLGDLWTDDDGRAALADIQFLAFNLVLLVYFLGTYWTSPTELPELPLGLVALTGTAALAYTGNKAALRNAPTITSVTRASGSGPIRAGKAIEIRGANFVPPGGRTLEQLTRLRVKVGKQEVLVKPEVRQGRGEAIQAEDLKNPTAERIVVRLPDDLTGVRRVRVVTAAGLESNEYEIEVDPAT